MSLRGWTSSRRNFLKENINDYNSFHVTLCSAERGQITLWSLPASYSHSHPLPQLPVPQRDYLNFPLTKRHETSLIQLYADGGRQGKKGNMGTRRGRVHQVRGQVSLRACRSRASSILSSTMDDGRWTGSRAYKLFLFRKINAFYPKYNVYADVSRFHSVSISP